MNKILFFILYFALTNCVINITDCTNDNAFHGSIYINTASDDYKYNYEFDWTDEDSYNFKVPFTSSFGENDIIPFFINASTSGYNDGSYTYKTEDKENNITAFLDLDAELIYNKYQVFYPFDYEVNDKTLTATIKGEEFKANPNDVNQKFIKYFGWAVCSDEKKVTVTVSNIMVTFNNGNYFSISKILLATLALLFL